MKRILLILCGLSLAATPLLACPRTVYHRRTHAHTHTAAVVATPVVAVTPAVILVPTYSVSYVPPVAVPATTPAVEPAGPVQTPAPPAQQPTAKAPATPAPAAAADGPAKVVGLALANRCASCHAAAVAQDKGGGFELIDKDNRLVELSANERRSLLRRIGSTDPKKQMPPPAAPQLTADERKAFTDLLSDPPAK